MSKTTWDVRYLRLAREVSTWSKDPSTKVGAVIVRPNKTIASMGFNGFPRGFPDDVGLYNDRKQKYQFIVHAEMNAILTASEPLTGYTLYTYPLPPCGDCMKSVVQAGITRWVSVSPTAEQLDRWRESLDATYAMSMRCKIEYTEYDRNL